MKTFKLFTGTSNRELAQHISTHLRTDMERVEVGRFQDGEIRVELLDSVRGSDAYIIQSTCAPANDTLMELMLLADTLHRSSANRIIAIVPYLGYARQDRRPGDSRVPISARVVADMFKTVHIDHVVAIDLHTTQIQGFFGIPVDNISTTKLFVDDIRKRYNTNELVIVSPDAGGAARARALATQLDNCDIAIVDKRRPKANVSEVMNIIGDVNGKTCIITDDMVDTAGTLSKAADALVKVGQAREVVAYCTHGVLSGPALTNINASALSQLVITDTIPLKVASDKIRQISVGPILGETIRRIDIGDSVSELLH